MESLPEWTSLIVSRDVIPYDDLKIAPGYGRKLLLPDDIPPVLALPWALGPKVPRVNRAQDDGSLNVFVTGQSGGGGGGALPIATFPDSQLGPSEFSLIADVDWPLAGPSSLRYLYGFTLGLSGLGGTSGTGFGLRIDVENGAHTTRPFDLWNGQMTLIPGSTELYPLNVTVAFPYKIDLLASVADTSWQFVIRGPGGDASCGCCLQVYASNT